MKSVHLGEERLEEFFKHFHWALLWRYILRFMGCIFLALRERKYKILLREDESDCPLYDFQTELFPFGVS